MFDYVKDLPWLGAGLGYRTEISQEIMQNRKSLDFLEIISDNYLFSPARRKQLAQLCASFQVIPHGTNLSIGRAGSLDRQYLKEIKQISQLTGAPYYSDHLALTSLPGIDLGHLSPIWYTEESLQVIIENVRTVQDYLEKPLVLETITYDLEIPGASISQPEFFRRLTDETGCGILLDVTNLYINSVNHRFDPVAFLDQFPLERVVQVHLAGGFWQDDYLIDGHSEAVPRENWQLFEEVAKRIRIRGTIIERDDNFGEFEALLNEVNQARKIILALLAT